MRAVAWSLSFPGAVHEAEACWYDTSRWTAWVDGLDRVVSVDDSWPCAGATVVWDSGPAGRGRVVEQVVEYEARSGQMVDVEDDSISGRQRVSFTPVDGSVEVAMSLEYELKRRSLVTPLVDVLFIKRAMTASLRTTLTRFGVQLAAAREANRPPS
jgi:Polyketide cyclase / dehydrase and lipid transport